MGKHKMNSHSLGNSKTTGPLCVKKTHTKRGKCLNWTDDNMKSAVSAVTSRIMSQRRASQMFGIPRCTLHTRVAGKTSLSARPGHPTKLSFEQEMKLVDYAGNRASLGIGFGKRPFFVYASQFAEKFGVKFVNGLPSEKWWSGVKRRHPELRLRQPEGTAAVRHKCMEDSLRIKCQEDANNSKACIAPILQQSKDESSTQISKDFKKPLMTDETTKEQRKVKPELKITDKHVGKVNQYSGNYQAAHSSVYTSGCQERKPKKRMSCSSTTRPSRNQHKSDCCFICGESETDQPTEEWIQCSDCFSWVHEECANVENNIFVCEKCV